MDTKTAHNILNQATQPQAAGRMTREHFVECQMALDFFAQQTQQLEVALRRVKELEDRKDGKDVGDVKDSKDAEEGKKEKT